MKFLYWNVTIKELTGLLNFVGRNMTITIKSYNNDETLSIEIWLTEAFEDLLETYLKRVRNVN